MVMMRTLDVARKSAQVLGGGRGYDAAWSPPYGGRPCGGLSYGCKLVFKIPNSNE